MAEIFDAPKTTLQLAQEFLEDVSEMLADKNRRYGNSAADPVRIFSKAPPDEQLLVRIDDKISRIVRGAGLDHDNEDVLADLVGYLALLVGVRKALQ